MDGRGFAKGDLLTYETMVEGSVDETRISSRFLDNFAVGQAREEQKHAYHVLLKAFNACIALCGPGITTDVLEEAAEQVIRQGGFADYGFWRHGEPLVWHGLFQGTWQGVSLGSSVLLDNLVVSIEPTIVKVGLRARLMNMSNGTVRENVLKVGRMVMIEETGYELPLGPPPATLQTI